MDHTNGVRIGFPQSDSVRVKMFIIQSEIYVRLTEHNCITPLKVNLNPLMGKYCPSNGYFLFGGMYNNVQKK